MTSRDLRHADLTIERQSKTGGVDGPQASKSQHMICFDSLQLPRQPGNPAVHLIMVGIGPRRDEFLVLTPRTNVLGLVPGLTAR